jgi:hypothetical protein
MSAQQDTATGAPAANDADQQETREWMEALAAVIEKEGPERAHYLLVRLAGLDARRRLQPLLARRGREPWRRPALHPGPQLARHLRPRLPGRPADRGAARHFRQEVDGKGLSSYPHPWLMPDFWQFPTVSMGLGPLMAIYQARFLKYLHGRGLPTPTHRKVWAFMGDGEMDEPESLGAIGLAGARGPGQPGLRHQLQPAAPGRSGARQRQDHPGAGRRVPRRRLERHQGWSGAGLGRAAGARQERQAQAADDGNRGRRVPEHARPTTALTRASISSAATRRPPSWSSHMSDEDISPATAAATTRRRSTPPTTTR